MISRRRRSTERRLGSLDKARLVLRAIADGSRDPYEGYREVYGIYLDSSGAVEELKPDHDSRGRAQRGPQGGAVAHRNLDHRTRINAAITALEVVINGEQGIRLQIEERPAKALFNSVRRSANVFRSMPNFRAHSPASAPSK